MRYTWIPFYKEFAEKLLNYRNDRASLLSLIYENRAKLLAKYLHDNKGVDDLLVDVDPFTVFGLFNRGIKSEKRIESTRRNCSRNSSIWIVMHRQISRASPN